MFKKITSLILILCTCVVLSFPDTSWAYVKVKGYYRSDGTYVRPHVRSDPNGLKFDNYSWAPSQGLYNKTYGERGAKWDTPTYITDPEYYIGKDLYENGKTGGSSTTFTINNSVSDVSKPLRLESLKGSHAKIIKQYFPKEVFINTDVLLRIRAKNVGSTNLYTWGNWIDKISGRKLVLLKPGADSSKNQIISFDEEVDFVLPVKYEKEGNYVVSLKPFNKDRDQSVRLFDSNGNDFVFWELTIIEKGSSAQLKDEIQGSKSLGGSSGDVYPYTTYTDINNVSEDFWFFGDKPIESEDYSKVTLELADKAILRFYTEFPARCSINVYYVKFGKVHTVYGKKYVKNHKFTVRKGGDEYSDYSLAYQCSDKTGELYYVPQWLVWK